MAMNISNAGVEENRVIWHEKANRFKNQIGQTYWYYPQRCRGLDELRSGMNILSNKLAINSPSEITVEEILPDEYFIFTNIKFKIVKSTEVGYMINVTDLSYETNAIEENKSFYGILKCLSKNSPETIANAPSIAAKAEADKLDFERQTIENANKRIKLQDEHSFRLPNEDIKVFDEIIMGLSTMVDINKIASRPQFSNAACSAGRKCKFNNLEESKYGYLGDIPYSTNDGNIPLTFSKFQFQGKNFSATFYEDLIVELRVMGTSYQDEIDESLAKELIPIFEKKYKRLKTTHRKEKKNYRSYTYTYDSWSDRSGAFEIHLKATRKILDIPEHTCLGLIRSAQAAGFDTSRQEWECRKVTDNLPRYKLAYRYPEGFAKASAELKKFQIEQTEKVKNESIKKISNF